MSETKINAETRESFGKGAARKLRAAGRTPAVIYGHGHDTRHIDLPAHEVALALRTKNALLELTIAGKSELVLVKSASKDPVTQIIEHVDLVEVKKGEKVHVEVPVHVIGEPMGGTVIDLEHKTVKVEAEATHIPNYLELHITKENPAGHHYLVSDLVIPDGVVMELDPEELVAAVIETKAGAAEDEADTETAAEGEAKEAATDASAE
ncbi:MAG: 50S ribosomal protein L25/general stress protein Ctc [Aquiluna sp.]|nr:50S ribosomal protein L25/general stress protein Ctc [Aquiluna sp.]